MNGISRQPARHWSSAEFLSAKDFVRHGVLILLVFAVIHLFGLREYTSVLNGTTGAVDMNPDDAALLGIIYVLFYLAAVLLAPIFFIAGGLLAIWEKFRTKRQTST